MAVGKPASKGSRDEANERLLVQAAQKDPERFAELYESHFERVYAFIAHRVRDRAVAEDLTADVFHKALANLSRFDWRGIPFAAWLYRIAANLVADQWKKGAKEIVDDPPEGSTEPNYDEIEHRAQLFRLVDGLPEGQRQVIVSRFAEEKSIRDIAQELGRTEGAVKQLQFRALEKLRVPMGGKNG
ncbi:MAG: sigma-70 family RNA polymerase sigma factor [Acidobacteriia bacterium]|nr:sigma-70 family RNA polymerase sigma factor [Terriglobia bacterium]